jgi:hypothetical protein
MIGRAAADQSAFCAASPVQVHRTFAIGLSASKPSFRRAGTNQITSFGWTFAGVSWCLGSTENVRTSQAMPFSLGRLKSVPSCCQDLSVLFSFCQCSSRFAPLSSVLFCAAAAFGDRDAPPVVIQPCSLRGLVKLRLGHSGTLTQWQQGGFSHASPICISCSQ